MTAGTCDRRVGIIGAGASGLAAAYALKERGFSRVTVLEADAEPGGKCCTFEHGDRSFEIGAAIITPAYRQTWELAKRHGVTPKLCLGAGFVNADSGAMYLRPYVPPAVSSSELLTFPAQVVQVLRSGLFRRMQQFPRLDQMHPSLCEPFESWCTRQGFRSVLEMFRPWASGFGYGFMDEVPTAYMLNYMCLMGPSYELHDDGYRGLWRRVASDLDVRCNHRVTRVERGATIKVYSKHEALEFDEIIVACPLEAALGFLDVSEQERALFSQVRYVDYQVVAAQVSGMPKRRYNFVPRNLERDASDKPMFMYRRYPDRDLINFYSFRGPGGLDAAEREAVSLAERMGGRVRSILTARPWRYFPHVSSEHMRDGFHAKMEALQGARGTFYASEVLSFSCVEPVVAYATDLVRRRFARDLESQPGWLSRSVPENTQQAAWTKTG